MSTDRDVSYDLPPDDVLAPTTEHVNVTDLHPHPDNPNRGDVDAKWAGARASQHATCSDRTCARE